MPNYDFACIECDIQLEKNFSFHEDHRVECPKCGNRMAKVYPATPAHFKGGGWGGQ
mgnify:CR=1 FL=1